MRAYSARSMERTIGRYSKLIKSRVAAGKNAGNLVERLSMRSYFNLAVNIHDLLDTIQPKHRSLDDFIELPLSSPFNCNHQLWSSFVTHSLSSSSFIESVSPNIIITQLKNFYNRSVPGRFQHITIINDTIKIAARALINNHLFSSCMYRRIRSENRRGNQYVLFHASYKS